MGLIRRLWRVVRAELGTDDAAWADAGTPAWEPAQRDGAEPSRRPPEAAASGQPRDPRLAGLYANLEVPYGSDLNLVRQSWRRLVKKYHPDRHGSDPERRRVATELTAELTREYRELEEILSVRSDRQS